MSFRLYVDEVGNDDLTHVADERHRYLSLTGIILQNDYARDSATPRLAALKAEIFRHDPDAPVILHRKDIMNRRGPFGVLGDEALCRRFDEALLRYLCETDYTVITAVIDKKAMLAQRHWRENHPYHFLMSILVEKFAQWLGRRDAFGDVMPEKRRGKKDAELQAAYEAVLDGGTQFVDRERIRARLRARNLKFREKSDNVTGLQICDLVAHPSHMYVRQLQNHEVQIGPFAQRIIPELVARKFDRSPFNGLIRGYGIKYLP